MKKIVYWLLAICPIKKGKSMTKTRFRIYTEYVHTRHITEIVSKYFTDYSMFSGIGHYENVKERCLVIEIIDSGCYALEDVKAICQEINTKNHQACCLITSEIVETFLVKNKVRG